MVSKLFTAALVAVLSISNVFGNTAQWNQDLQETCGTNMREIDSQTYIRKVLNGTRAHFNESPWSVGVYIPDYKNHTIYTTGTLISDHHVISYDWVFLTNDTTDVRFRFDLSSIDGYACSGNDPDLILPSSLTRQVAVFADLLRADRFSGRKRLDVRRVKILNGCVKPRTANRVALITLSKPIIKEIARAKPICLGSAEQPRIEPSYTTPKFTFYGFGDNRGDVMDATLRHTTIHVVPCEFPSAETFCVLSKEPLCNGDFGGAAVKKIDDSIRAFGMYVDGPYECAKATHSTKYTFVNLTYVAEAICQQTHVCPTYLPETPKTTLRPLTTSIYIPTREPATRPTGEPVTEGPTDSTDTTIIHDGEGDTKPTGVPSTSEEPRVTGGETTDEDTGTGGYTTGMPITTGGPPTGEDESSTKPQTTGRPPITEGPVSTEGPQTTDEGTQTDMTCYVDDDDDIHIHIKLGKYRKTGNEEDIEVIRNGPNAKRNKRAAKAI